MAKLVTCKMCGKEFMTAKPNKQYCSIACREAGGRLARLRWEDNNPEYNKAYMQKYRKEKQKNEN